MDVTGGRGLQLLREWLGSFEVRLENNAFAWWRP